MASDSTRETSEVRREGDEPSNAVTAPQTRYERQHPRIPKPDIYMVTALWMERSPLAECPSDYDGEEDAKRERESETGNEAEKESDQGKPVLQETSSIAPNKVLGKLQKINKAGAVYVLPNDRALSVDCSQAGVHAAVSALNKFGQDRVKGCLVYLSRRPCSFCAKLLVQAGVDKVFYLPIEPEVNDPQDVKRVDKMFKAASTSLSAFIPRVTKTVIEGQKLRASPYTPTRDEDAIIQQKNQLMQEYWNDEWTSSASRSLSWPAFSDENMKAQIWEDMDHLMEWMARTTMADVPDDVEFIEIDPQSKKGRHYKDATGDERPNSRNVVECTNTTPTPSDKVWQKHALHMTRLAQMLSQRSDDPTRGVGCVLMLQNDVVAIGWNGFPAKALYGEFPRASYNDEARDRKEPYVIHAVQNALLTRNIRNLNHGSSTLFSNKIPCAECVPLLIQAGVKHVVVPYEPNELESNHKVFFRALERKQLTGYWPDDKQQIEAKPGAVKIALVF